MLLHDTPLLQCVKGMTAAFLTPATTLQIKNQARREREYVALSFSKIIASVHVIFITQQSIRSV